MLESARPTSLMSFAAKEAKRLAGSDSFKHLLDDLYACFCTYADALDARSSHKVIRETLNEDACWVMANAMAGWA